MDDFKKIAIPKSNNEGRKGNKADKIMDWLWGPEEKRTVLGLLRGRKKKKQLQDEKENND